MNIVISIIIVIIGIILIVKGSDFFVSAAVSLSRVMGISEIVIGATIISVGTTLPELITSVTAMIMEVSTENMQYAPIAIGNSIGSMCCNMGLVLAMVAIIKPIKCEGKFIIKSVLLMLATVMVVVIFALGTLTWWHAFLLLPILILFIMDNLTVKDKLAIKPKKVEVSRKQKVYMSAQFTGGAIAIAVGAFLTVNNIEILCEAMNIPTQIIGATVVAIGTSLPELATSITALRKGNTDIGIGNIIGANIINATLLMSLIAVVGGSTQIDAFTSNISIYFILAITAIALLPTIFTRKVARWQGVLLAITYISLILVNVVYILPH